MTRAMYPITDAEGETVATFDREAATELASTRRWNGQNKDNRWVVLLRTARGRYVTEHCSLWQGEDTFWRLADPDEAARFLARWREPGDPEVPADLVEQLDALEV